MSVYRRESSKVYSYDFRYHGHRFHGSTGETEKRKAEIFEKDLKAKVRAKAIDLSKPISFRDASTLYWEQVGQFHKNQDDTWRAIGWLQVNIGSATLISTISDFKVAELVALRRSEGVTPATVNRTVLDPLRGLMTRAAKVWKIRLDLPDWKNHYLPVSQERIRELTVEEEDAYVGAVRLDYQPLVATAILTGCRQTELVATTPDANDGLKWRDIDWRGGFFTVTGKGDRSRKIPLTPAVRTILKDLPRAHANVFTYETQKAAPGIPRKTRMPITKQGVKTMHRRLREKLGMEDFRWHDFRHTALTRLVRQTGNLKLAQQLAGHADIKTTARYAHATQSDLMNGMIATEITTERNNKRHRKLKKQGKSG